MADSLPSNGRLKDVVETALHRTDTNPFQIIQDIVTQLEQDGIPMSASNSLKLSMWLRQLDRYVQMAPNTNVQSEIVSIIMKKKLKGVKPSDGGQSSSPADNSMMGKKKGGIDLNPNSIDLQIRGTGFDFIFELDDQYLEMGPVDGLTPIIINISPVTNIQLLLGESPRKNEKQLTLSSK